MLSRKKKITVNYILEGRDYYEETSTLAVK
jgi:hypothetical protein